MDERGKQLANELAGELSTLPQLADQDTPEWGQVASPLIAKALKEYGNQVARECAEIARHYVNQPGPIREGIATDILTRRGLT